MYRGQVAWLQTICVKTHRRILLKAAFRPAETMCREVNLAWEVVSTRNPYNREADASYLRAWGVTAVRNELISCVASVLMQDTARC